MFIPSQKFEKFIYVMMFIPSQNLKVRFLMMFTPSKLLLCSSQFHICFKQIVRHVSAFPKSWDRVYWFSLYHETRHIGSPYTVRQDILVLLVPWDKVFNWFECGLLWKTNIWLEHGFCSRRIKIRRVREKETFLL